MKFCKTVRVYVVAVHISRIMGLVITCTHKKKKTVRLSRILEQLLAKCMQLLSYKENCKFRSSGDDSKKTLSFQILKHKKLYLYV